MAIQNGHKLWFEGDLSSDYIELNGSIEPYGFVWDDPAYKITEVYIDGNPCLESANNLVNKSGAHDIVTDWRNAIIEPALREHAESIASISNV
jgi:hypothetical protein